MTNYKWQFYATDTGGGRHNFKITAPDKETAIKKGMEKAAKNAKGDINPTWECKLIRNF